MKWLSLLLALCLAGCHITLYTDVIEIKPRQASLQAPVAIVGSVTNHVEKLHAAQVNMVERVEVVHGY